MLLAIKDNNTVYVARSITSTRLKPFYTPDLILSDNSNVWKVKGNENTLMACDYHSRDTDLMKYDDEIFQGELTFNRLIQEIVPKMKDKLESFGRLDNNNRFDSVFIVAQKDKIYRIDILGCVTEEEYAVSGTGNEVLLGSIMRTKDNTDVLSRIRDIFIDCRDFTHENVFPIIVMDTKTCKETIIES